MPRRLLSTVEAFELSYWRVYSWSLWFFLILIIVHFPIAVWLVGGCLFIGLAWTLLSLLRHGDMIRNNRVLSLDPQHRAILDRARTTAWCLVFVDAALLPILVSQL